MIFLPFGVATSEIVDPAELAGEFVEASRCASHTDQWNWTNAAFSSKDHGVFAPPAYFDSVGTTVLLRNGSGTWGQAVTLPDDVGADTKLWKIPFNRGFHVIGDGVAGNSTRLTWTAVYPELLLAGMFFVYIRRTLNTGGTHAAWDAFWAVSAGRKPRVQVKLRCDGVILPGTGPSAKPSDGRLRGTGIAVRSLGMTVFGATLLPPGPHTLEGVAMQTSCYASGEESNVVGSEDGEADEGTEVGPSDGICIGNRRLLYMRVPRATWMPGF